MNVIARTAGALALVLLAAGVTSTAAAQVAGQTSSAASTAGTPGSAAPQSLPQATAKIAWINSQRILSQAPGAAEAQAAFEKEVNGYKATMQRMQDSLRSMIDSYQKSEATLSAPARDTRQKAIQQRQAEYQSRAAAMDSTAREHEAAFARPIMEQINQVLEQVRKEQGYSLIFDVASQSGQIVAADPSLDISEVVISRLKTMGPAKPATSPTTPAKKP